MEEAQLKAKKEKLALESEMAAADAKVNVFLKSESLLEKMSSKSTKGSAKSDTSSTYPSTEYIAPARTKGSNNSRQTREKNKSTPTVKTHQSHEKIQKQKGLIPSSNKGNSCVRWRCSSDPLLKHLNRVLKARLRVCKTQTNPKIWSAVTCSCKRKKAKQQLEWNFNNRIKISSAFTEKALNWTTLKAEDGPALRSYAFFLGSCFNTMQEVNFVEELENSANLRTIVFKLPFKLRDKWRTIACSIQDGHNRKVKFKDLLEFTERETRAALDPVFGDIQSATDKRGISKVTTTTKSNFKSPGRGSSFATTVTTVAEKMNDKLKLSYTASNAVEKPPCVFCD